MPTVAPKLATWVLLYFAAFSLSYLWPYPGIVIVATIALIVGLRAIAMYGLGVFGGAWRGLLSFLVFMWLFEMLYIKVAWPPWLPVLRDAFLLLAFISVVYYVSKHVLIIGRAASTSLYLASLVVLFLVAAASLSMTFFAPRLIYVGRYAVGMLLNGLLFSLSLPVLESFKGGLMARPWTIWLAALVVLIAWNTARLACYAAGVPPPMPLFNAIWGANYVMLAASLRLKAFPA